MDGRPLYMITLITLGVFLSYMLIRQLLGMVLAPYYCMDQWKIARTNLPNAIVILTLVSILFCGFAALSGIADLIVRKVLLCLAAFIFVVIFYRNFEILSWKGRRFKGFLYLCALELMPAILLVASAIIF